MAESGRLTIAMVAPPWYPVPPTGYGGIELVVHLLTRGLRRNGHRVLLFAAEGSEHDAIVSAPAEWRSDLGGRDALLREVAYAGQVYKELRATLPGGVDVIHEHSGLVGLMTAELSGIAPAIHTVHGPLWEPQLTAYEGVVERSRLVAISDAQRATAPTLSWIGTVHNAVDTSSLTIGSREDKDPYLLVLARICADKGQHIAIEVARRAGMQLVLAGKVDSSPEAATYYRDHIEPAVDGRNVIHIPNVAGLEKAQLLARAEALLAPLTWPEPFGLSMVEAMVSGTPCIAFNRGAVPELVDEGKTGFVVGDVDDMVEAVSWITEIDPFECAKAARRRFSPDAMVQGYVRLYREIVMQAGEKGEELSA
jgi:glycosyltransferase involved in cell wall biosynthesis